MVISRLFTGASAVIQSAQACYTAFSTAFALVTRKVFYARDLPRFSSIEIQDESLSNFLTILSQGYS